MLKKCLFPLLICLIGCATAKTVEPVVVETATPAQLPTAVSPTPSPEPQAPSLEDKLRAYFPFNGNADDESAESNHGEVKGATLIADRFGNPDSAYQFDGEDDFITIPHDQSYAPTGSFTLSAWYYFVPQETQTWYSIVEKTDPEREGHSRWGFWVIRDRAEFCIQPASTSTHECLDSTTPLIENEWNHIVGVWSTKEITLFLNGEISLRQAHPIDAISNTNFDLLLGTDLYNKPRPIYLKGAIDDVRLYRRVLSDDEVFELHALESP